MCSICDYSCATNANLKNHINVVHEGKKPSKCLICDSIGTSKPGMKYIDAIHKEKKPYKCSICNYSCTTKGSLKIHIDAIYEGKKPHIS